MLKVQNKRILRILSLFDAGKKVLDSASIATLIGVSSRTVRDDMKALNFLLKSHGAGIRAEAGVGYTLRIDDSARYRQFKRDVIDAGRGAQLNDHIIPSDHNDRIAFIIAKLLTHSLQRRAVNQLELADTLFISLSTLKKYLKEIKKSLRRFGLEITADRLHGIGIRGDEAQIRYCISEYMFNKSDLIDLAEHDFYRDIFSRQEIDAVKRILLDAIAAHDIHLADIAFKNLLVHIMITLKRADAKNTVEYSETEIAHLKSSPDFAAAKEITAAIRQRLGVDISKEAHYLTQHFMSSKKYMVGALDERVKRAHQSLIGEILAKVKADIGVDFFHDETLISGLMIHLAAAVNRLRFNMNIRNDFLALIKKSYPLAFEMAVAAGKVLETAESLKTNENEIGFLAIHFGAALERNSCGVQAARTVILVCGTGLATAMLLKSKLQRRFGGRLRIVAVKPLYELTEANVRGVDFIFTTVPIDGFHAENIIQIEPILTEEDLSVVERRISGKVARPRDGYRGFFKRELFFPRLRAHSARDVLTQLTDALMRFGYIDEAVKQSVFEREKMAATELGGLIAIPHALDNGMKEAVIAVAVLEKAIVWHREKVQVVFLMSIPKNKYNVWEPVFKKLYRYFVSELGVNALIKSPRFDVFMDALRE